MAMKNLLYRLRPVQIYIVLVLSILYFLVQLYLSQITHALTLLVCAYHMLCNIVALSGCIITIKQCKVSDNESGVSGNFGSIFSKSMDNNKFIEVNEAEADRHEVTLRNTFGWMRIEILTMLIGVIFLGAFCFSLFVEAIQTLIHIDHMDTMHYPVAVFTFAIVGLILNGLCYLLIGGYTYHQSNVLYISPSGEVILDQAVTENGLVRNSRCQSKAKGTECIQNNAIEQNISSSIQVDATITTTTTTKTTPNQQVSTDKTSQRKHTFGEVMRDISSTLYVMMCTVIVHSIDNENITKYIDPMMSIVSGLTLLVLSYPYMKASCFILLQTIPASIDIELFRTDLLKTFDEIVSVHDLQIWQLTSSKYVSTVHILFLNPKVYVKIKEAVEDFFHNQGITIVTIQLEFNIETNMKKTGSVSTSECLIGCQNIECAPKTCCSANDLHEILSLGTEDKKKKMKKSNSDRISSSLLSLNISTLRRKMMGSTQDIIKKSASESHVAHIGSDESGESQNPSYTPSTANNLYSINDSVDELKETEFHEQCGERSEQRLPTAEQMSQHSKTESIAEYEDSNLLVSQQTKPSSEDEKIEESLPQTKL